MATYTELRAMFNDDTLRNRIEVAAVIKAHGILAEEAPSATRLDWARGVLGGDSYTQAQSLLKYALAANAAATVQSIMAVTDETLLQVAGTAVDAMYP